MAAALPLAAERLGVHQAAQEELRMLEAERNLLGQLQAVDQAGQRLEWGIHES